MRKDKEQQKKTACKQLKMFTRKGEPDDGKTGGTSNQCLPENRHDD